MLELNKVYNIDYLEGFKLIEDNSIDLIITDPPYEEKYNYIWQPLAMECSRVLKPTGNYITLCGHYQVPYILEKTMPYLRYWWIFWMVHNNLN